jgi:acetyltransferase-like isoleucine patch superfamily enzyme
MAEARTLSWDWYPGTIPENVVLDPEAYIESTYSFFHYRSRAPIGVRIGRGASVYLGVMFDLGPAGRVSIGDFSLLNGAWIQSDAAVEIGDHALISWRVVLMDSYRVPFDARKRRRVLERVPRGERRLLDGDEPGRPIRIGRCVWIGFDACVLPGVTIGDGSIVAARSVVLEDVPPFTIVAGNPARPVRRLEPPADLAGGGP